MVNVVLAGGGTAGHTSPLIATAKALQERGVTVSCIGTPKGLEGRVIPEAGLELDMIPPVPLPRTVNADLFKVPGRLAGAVRKAGAVLKQRRADVVVGFGGYVSLPAYLAARKARIPVVIHEQNAVPGLANKIAA
ncbi:MAG: glycosyltransferase, partial [Cutibacterium avidum]|nr:glycosyltransferase [Cutibacterium avidum]